MRINHFLKKRESSPGPGAWIGKRNVLQEHVQALACLFTGPSGWAACRKHGRLVTCTPLPARQDFRRRFNRWNAPKSSARALTLSFTRLLEGDLAGMSLFERLRPLFGTEPG